MDGRNWFANNNSPYSVSVTGAIHVLLLDLIGATGAVGSRWSDFETLCALNELQRVVMKTKDEVLRRELPKLVFLK